MHIWLIKHKSTTCLSDGSYYMSEIMGLHSIKYSSMGTRKVCQLGSFNLDSLLRVFYSFLKNFIYLAALGLSCSMWGLVPWPGFKPWLSALGAQSLSHWTTREVPVFYSWIFHIWIVWAGSFVLDWQSPSVDLTFLWCRTRLRNKTWKWRMFPYPFLHLGTTTLKLNHL